MVNNQKPRTLSKITTMSDTTNTTTAIINLQSIKNVKGKYSHYLVITNNENTYYINLRERQFQELKTHLYTTDKIIQTKLQ